jgi:hypothetical protein
VKEEGEASGTQPDANVFIRNNDEAPRQSRGQQSGTLKDLDNDSLADSSEDSLRFSSQLDPAEQNVLSRELEQDFSDLTLSEQEGEASRVECEQRHRSYLLRVIANYPPVDDYLQRPLASRPHHRTHSSPLYKRGRTATPKILNTGPTISRTICNKTSS